MVGIYGQRIIKNSPCDRCKEYFVDIGNAFENFLKTNELSYLDELQVTHDAIKQDRKDLGSQMLSAISDGCKTCDYPDMLLDSNLCPSLANYSEKVSKLKETDSTGEDLNEVVQQCARDLSTFQHARKLKKDARDNRDRIIISARC